MKYTELKIQTQRDAPNNARTEGFAFLVRAGYLTRENELLPLGEASAAHLQKLSSDPDFLTTLGLQIHKSEEASFFPLASGNTEIAHCKSCSYTERFGMALFQKTPFSEEESLPLEKVSTPDCNSIEALANFLNIPKEKTAKALMYTRVADGNFLFIVIRGDMQLSEEKLRYLFDDVRPAAAEEIANSGAVAGYASPIGLQDGLIIIDNLIAYSPNLAAGANETGYHFINTNAGRDYMPEIIQDLIQAKEGDPCVKCGEPLSVINSIVLSDEKEFDFKNILLALAETHHDDKGLTIPPSASPFDVYLMHVPGKTMDTRAKAEEIYSQLQGAGISVLFDDRDERAGVKFNDADLIGCPIRITVGEKALQNGMVELKNRKSDTGKTLSLEEILSVVYVSTLS